MSTGERDVSAYCLHCGGPDHSDRQLRCRSTRPRTPPTLPARPSPTARATTPPVDVTSASAGLTPGPDGGQGPALGNEISTGGDTHSTCPPLSNRSFDVAAAPARVAAV